MGTARVGARLDAASQPDVGYPYNFIKDVDGVW